MNNKEIRKIADLRVSEFSEKIYDHNPPQDLIESIRLNGVIQPIWISEDNIIISGHRRVNACKILGIEEIEVEVKEYSDSLIIEANRYREKTWKEKLREAEELEKILKSKAKENQVGNLKQFQDTVCPNSDKRSEPINTGKEISKVLGMGRDTYYRIKKIKEKVPEFIDKIDEGKLTVNQAYNKLKAEEKKEYAKKVNIPFPDGKYSVIYMDPPWPIGSIVIDKWESSIEDKYPTMTLEEIQALPIESLSADDCALFMWTTHTFLPDALKIIEKWGFRYHCLITWDKGNGWTQFGFNRRTEFLIYAYKGKMLINQYGEAIPTLISEPKTIHSKKPDIIRDMIKNKTPEKRLEMFARGKYDGWDVWGNEEVLIK